MSESLLEKLERRLYGHRRPPLPKKEGPKEKEEAEKKEEDIDIGATSPLSVEPPSSRGISVFGRRKIARWLTITIILTTSLAVFIFWRGFFSFTKGRVEVTITGPNQVVAGEQVSWEVEIRNNNRNALEDGKIEFIFPKNSLDPEDETLLNRDIEDIGTLNPGQSARLEFSAIVIGGEGFERDIEAIFTFRPAGSSLIFQQKAENSLTIEHLPIRLLVNGPPKSVSGDTISISLQAFNESSRSFKNMRIRVEYPSGFRFEESSEPLEEFNTVWQIGEILPQERKEIELTGMVTGLEGEGKIFRAFLEGQDPISWQVYKETAFRSDLAVVPLDLSIKLLEEENGAVSVDKKLTYEISWKNNFDVPLSGLTLSVALDGEMFDLPTLDTNGIFNSNSKTINWTQIQEPKLRTTIPNDSGKVSFKIRTLPSFGFRNFNPVLSLDVRLKSETVPTGFTVEKLEVNKVYETKVNGVMELGTQLFYNEPSGRYTNTGPYPLKVGEETTFTVHWKIKSFANSFKDVRIKTLLPTGTDWGGNLTPSSVPGDVGYDALTREVVWSIENLDANQGLSSPLEGIFIIVVHPTPSQKDKIIPLISESELTATDEFTKNRFTTVNPLIDSRLPDDLGGGGSFRGRVE